jgi:Domain of unknown function (DUF4913)
MPDNDDQAIVEAYRAQLSELAARTKSDGSDRDGELLGSLVADLGEPLYADLESWVRDYYCVVFARRLSATTRWCPRWNEHHEVAVRMEALWRTWEIARIRDELGIADWLRTELDHHAPIIHAPDGPFAGCVDGEHRSPTTYQTEAPVVTKELALSGGGVH